MKQTQKRNQVNTAEKQQEEWKAEYKKQLEEWKAEFKKQQEEWKAEYKN